VIRPIVEHLPSGGVDKQVWPWCQHSTPPAEVDRCQQAFMRRFDFHQEAAAFTTVPDIRDMREAVAELLVA